MFDAEKPLRANVAWLIDLPALTITTIQRDRKTIEVRAAGYEPLAFDVRISADHSTTYQGELKKIQ